MPFINRKCASLATNAILLKASRITQSAQPHHSSWASLLLPGSSGLQWGEIVGHLLLLGFTHFVFTKMALQYRRIIVKSLLWHWFSLGSFTKVRNRGLTLFTYPGSHNIEDFSFVGKWKIVTFVNSLKEYMYIYVSVYIHARLMAFPVFYGR